MRGSDLIAALQAAGITRGSGVPCSYFGDFFEVAHGKTGFTYVPAPNEGSAVALASSFSLSGQPGFVVLQNSGLGNAINPLTSLCLPYGIPLLIFVSGRAWNKKDEAQHEVMGENLENFLKQCRCDVRVCPKDPVALKAQVLEMASAASSSHRPQAMIIPSGSFDLPTPAFPAGDVRPTRAEVLAVLLGKVRDQVLFSTTGYTSRDLFTLQDRPLNFYMQGSMGHAASLALGVAMEGKPVVVLDGDGACLMHLGALSMIAHARPRRFLHILLNNGTYESTGNQPTTAGNVDFCALARASGYPLAHRVGNLSDAAGWVDRGLAHDGPCLLEFPIRPTAETASPRISQKLSHHDIADRLQKHLR